MSHRCLIWQNVAYRLGMNLQAYSLEVITKPRNRRTFIFPLMTRIRVREIRRWIWLCRKYAMFIMWMSRLVCHMSRHSLNKFCRHEKLTKTASNARQTCRTSSWKKGRHSFRLPATIGHLGSSEELLYRMRLSKTVTWVSKTRIAACPRPATCTVVRSCRVL